MSYHPRRPSWPRQGTWSPLVGGILLAALLAAASSTAAAEAQAAANSVVLPLAEYFALTDQAARHEKAARDAAASREATVGEVVEQRTFLVWGEEEATTRFELEVLARGHALPAIDLPLLPALAAAKVVELDAAGQPRAGEARAALGLSPREGATLLPAGPGRYRVSAEGRVPLGRGGGSTWLTLPRVAAAVALTEVSLPAELEWSCPGAVVVADQVAGTQRTLQLATQRGQTPILQVRRSFAGGEAEKVLAHSLVFTLFQLRPEGPRRHDVVFYQVERGQLGSFEVKLPKGLEIEQAATDEGPIVPMQNGETLRVERAQQLSGPGYLVVSSTPRLEDGRFSWWPLQSELEVRASYLATATSIAAAMTPRPAADFQQVDLEDLPPILREALQVADLAAVWRANGAAAPEGASRGLEIATLPLADLLPTTVQRRETTTLLTVDGTLLFRDIFVLPATAKPLGAFDLALPAGATFWSARLDGEPIRPVERDGRLWIPLALRSQQQSTVEVVAVASRTIDPGRTQVQIQLPSVTAPVLEHHWRVLLPADRRYRFQQSPLFPVRPTSLRPPAKSVPASSPVVGRQIRSEESKQKVARKRDREELEEQDLAFDIAEEAVSLDRATAELGSLQQGLVGGLKPLPITIPESGKALELTGILPPATITLTLEAKGRS